jgi:hypothetical protein
VVRGVENAQAHLEGLGGEDADSAISSVTEASRLVIFGTVFRKFEFHKDIAFFRDAAQSRGDEDDVAEEGGDLLLGREDCGCVVFRSSTRSSSAFSVFEVCETDVAIFIMLKDEHILQSFEWREGKKSECEKKKAKRRNEKQGEETLVLLPPTSSKMLWQSGSPASPKISCRKFI